MSVSPASARVSGFARRKASLEIFLMLACGALSMFDLYLLLSGFAQS